jgi:hypothetical protein
MSNMSMGDGPPHWKRKMTDFARALELLWLLRRLQQMPHGNAQQTRSADLQRKPAAHRCGVKTGAGE